jgi:hypothetical protein
VLLSHAPRCGLGWHECFGDEEEQVARARDGEVHGESPAEDDSRILLGVHLSLHDCCQKALCERLLSQLTAGSQVIGISVNRKMLRRNESDEGDVTRFRRDDCGSSLHWRGRKMVIWSVAGDVAGFSQD